MFSQKPIDYEQIVSNRSYVLVTVGQLRVSEAVLREISVWEALKYQNNWFKYQNILYFYQRSIIFQNKYRYEIIKREKTKYRLWKFEDE